MLIDWFTVGAQAVNFAVLVWLMQRYLYRPVLAAIDAREKRVAAELADAAATQRQASAERDELQEKNTAFDAQRAGLLAEATEAAAVERRRLLEVATHDADAVAAQRADALRAEAMALQHALGSCTRQEVFAVARRTLADLASVRLEERVCTVFADRLRALDRATLESLTVAAAAAAAEPILLRSAFELADAERAALQQVVGETLATTIPLRFETAPDLVAGIELRAGGQRLEWSIAQYLDGLRQGVEALVTEAASETSESAGAASSAAPVPSDGGGGGGGGASRGLGAPSDRAAPGRPVPPAGPVAPPAEPVPPDPHATTGPVAAAA